jgi:hypothetical protein
MKKGWFDPAKTLVFISDNKKVIEHELRTDEESVRMMANGANHLYLSLMESRHVIVEKDFTKIATKKNG